MKDIFKIPNTLKSIPFCESCALVKRTIAPCNRNLQPQATVPFLYVGLDFWETKKTSLQGYNYVFGTSMQHAMLRRSRLQCFSRVVL